MGHKNHKRDKNTPTQAIVTPDKKDRKTGMTIPDESHVMEAKQYVDQNKK